MNVIYTIFRKDDTVHLVFREETQSDLTINRQQSINDRRIIRSVITMTLTVYRERLQWSNKVKQR
jgi:hypothetical protein